MKTKKIEIKNLPDFSGILGCLGTDKKKYTHLGALFVRKTACGKPMRDTLLSRDVTVTCPGCIAEIKYRADHPEAAKEEMGIVTHKREEK